LGGAPKDGKISKLAALAAKRRQQEASKSSSTGSDQPVSVPDYTDSLNKLRISQGPRSSPKLNLEDRLDEKEHKTEEPPIQENDERQVEQQLQAEQDLRARPSPFATLLTGQNFPDNPVTSSSSVKLEYAPKAFDFSQPSPDDVVTRAQTSNVRGKHQ
jgi:hypothetical protein